MDFEDSDNDDAELQELSPLMQALMPKMTACRIREYDPEDLDACVEIHRSNELDDLEPGALDNFVAFLEGGASYFLVVEHDGDVVGCGGLELVGDPDSATLMHSMIHHEYQRRGFGSALLAAQVSLLEAEDRPIELWTRASDETAGFYERLGFQGQPTFPGPASDTLQLSLNLRSEDIEDARAALLERNVQLVLNAEEDEEEDTSEPEGEEDL